MKINWQVKKINEDILNELSGSLGFNRYISSILINRGVNNLKDAYHYLNPRMSTLLSPFLMKGMYDAVRRIRKAISENERIGIFADSDLDGLTSLTILLRLLHKMGANPYYRYAVGDEDYGLRMEVIDEFRGNNIDLIITLDSGIRDIEEISCARAYGIDVIVCDHHEQGAQIPDAVIINPKQNECAYPFKELAGVGVTFKLCHAMLMSFSRSFNKLFLIITKDNDYFSYSFIKNGIVEDTQKVYDSESLCPLASKLQNDDNIILYDLGKDEGLIRGYFDGFKIYDLNSLMEGLNSGIVRSKDFTIDELCAVFSLKREGFENKSDIVNAVFSEIEYNNSPKIREFLDSIIDLVSVGTIADIMPIIGENRTIVHHGVKSINTTTHPGLSIIVGSLNNEVSTKNIAWDISPLLNTPGRFGKTDLTARFFLEEDIQSLKSILSEINILNNKRKKLTTELFNEIMNDIEESRIDTDRSLIFIQSAKVPEGLCGLLANRITDATGKPVIVVSLMGNKELVKGSGRSMGGLHFFSFVEPFSSLFVKIGGHQKAFGFTANYMNIEIIREKIELSLGSYNDSNRNFEIDMELPVDVIDYNFVNSLSLFEPYGYENEECTFLTRNADLKDFKRFGSENNHGKYTFNDNRYIEAIGWNMGLRMEECYARKKLDIIYKLENNVFNGRISPRMLILDID